MTHRLASALTISLVTLYGATASAQAVGGELGVEPEKAPAKAAQPDTALADRVKRLEREVSRLRAKVARLEIKKEWPPVHPTVQPPVQAPPPAKLTPAPRPAPARPAPFVPLEQLRIEVEVPGRDRATALRCGRLRASWELVNRVLGEICASRLDPHQRSAARKAARSTFLGERVLPLASGAWSYRARADLPKTRQAILSAVELDRRLNTLTFVLVDRRLRGPNAARSSALQACATMLESHGMQRAAPRDPQAPLVCSVRGKVALRGGVLRCVGLTGRVYDRRTGAVVARIELSPQRTELRGDTREAIARYGRVVGRALARGMVHAVLASAVPPCTD